MADRALEQIVAEIRPYRSAIEHEPGLAADVRDHVLSLYEVVLQIFIEGRDLDPGDLEIIRRPTAHLVRGVQMTDFLRAFAIGERVLWDGVRELATDPPSTEQALAFGGYLMTAMGAAGAVAAERYAEAEKQIALIGEGVERDVVDDLLAGRVPTVPARRKALARAGLGNGDDVAVVVARAAEDDIEARPLRVAGRSLRAAATTGGQPPLVIVRHGEIVMVVPVAGEASMQALTERLDARRAHLAQDGVALALALSTPHGALDEVPEAYREAEAACEHVPAGGGLISLSSLSAFDYLTLHVDPTASRLLPEAVRRFVVDDLRAGGALVETLRAYADANLNVTAAAEALHVHVNTAHYRLDKITEQTRLNLRHLSDVIELLIAVRLVGGAQ